MSKTLAVKPLKSCLTSKANVLVLIGVLICLSHFSIELSDKPGSFHLPDSTEIKIDSNASRQNEQTVLIQYPKERGGLQEAYSYNSTSPLTGYILFQPLSLNTATQEMLATLPGIGMQLADSIVEFRTGQGGFANVGELLGVRGIGQAKLKKLRPYVSI